MRARSIVALVMAIGTTAAGVVAAPAHAGRSDERPNVVVVMTDDQDYRSMNALPKVQELISKRGTTFRQQIVNYPLCCPSRATFLTGQYAHNHGVLWNNWPEGGYYKLDSRETLPVWLRRAGYRTVHIGKYLNETGERNPVEVPPGWEDWHGGVDPSTYLYYGFTLNHNGKLQTYPAAERYYQVDVVAGLARRAVRAAARDDRPFFMQVAPIAPHTNSTGARAEGTPAIPAPRHAGVFANVPMPRYPNFNELDLSDKPTTLSSYFPNPLGADEIDSLQNHYRGRMGSLLSVDDLVEGLVKTLKRTGEYENTVIVFTSDNGWILGEHRLRDPISEDGRATGVKYVPYEGSSRVPLVIAGGDFPRGRQVRGVTSNADLAPTILELTGARAARRGDGISLVDVARRPSRIDGRGVLIETGKNPRGVPVYWAIRTDRYRYDLQEDGQEGLYDLERDPWELQSVHADPRYKVVRDTLARHLTTLRSCRGAGCRVNVGELPEPAAR